MQPPIRLALSTSWLSQRHNDGEAMLREIAGLGFEYVELGHGIPLSLVPGVLKAVASGVIKVSSVHNFCPLPPGVTQPSPNYYEPSGALDSGRAQWVRHTLGTIAFARRVGADRMVSHSGSLHFFFGAPSNAFEACYAQLEDGAPDDGRLARLRKKLLKKLARRAPRAYDRIADCLERISDAAEEAGVSIGLENRDGILELPLDDDTEHFFKLLERFPRVGSWFDVGHARIKERMGVRRFESLLAATDANRLGFHLHNVSPSGRDHIGLTEEGSVDFAAVARHMRAGNVAVLEFSRRVSTEQVLASKAFAERLIASACATPPPTCGAAPKA